MTPVFLLAAAASTPTEPLELGANPVNAVLVLGFLSLLPFLLMMTTSFLKFAVVFSILRNALGTQQVPPNPVVMGLAVLLSVYVMAPVGAELYDEMRQDLEVSSGAETLSGAGAVAILRSFDKAKPVVRSFLSRHAHPEEVEMFYVWARQMGPEVWRAELREDDLLVLVPAFAISELTEAFAIGFLLFLPFLVIDMVVSNVLLAMGMHMLSPVVVSLPFKILLFIMADGWALLARGLLQGYV